MLKTNTAPAILLSDVVRGQVAGPGEPHDPLRPFAVVTPADEADLAAVVEYASVQGLRVASDLSRHGGGPSGPLHATILLRGPGRPAQ